MVEKKLTRKQKRESPVIVTGDFRWPDEGRYYEQFIKAKSLSGKTFLEMIDSGVEAKYINFMLTDGMAVLGDCAEGNKEKFNWKKKRKLKPLVAGNVTIANAMTHTSIIPVIVVGYTEIKGGLGMIIGPNGTSYHKTWSKLFVNMQKVEALSGKTFGQMVSEGVDRAELLRFLRLGLARFFMQR